MKPHSGKVDVFVRIRPTAKFSRGLIECLPDGQTVNIYNRKDSRKLQDSKKGQLSFWSFRLEGVLKDVSQEEVYARVCQRVLQGALEGYNGTVLCFGQTGAGKTYTMTGSTESYQYRGIIPRALQEVFREVDKRTEHSLSVLLSYLEIYNETLVDLLSPQQGSTHRSRGMAVVEEAGRGMFVRGLSLHPVRSEEEALNLMFQGEMSRIIGSHALNRNSSRSHCIFTMHIESRSRSLSDATYITSKLNLVDLAGSERLGKTGSGRQMLTEATYINKSLSFLEQVIVALADCHRDHVPYRQSKLTHVLKDSLGGNCNTVLVANIYGEAAQIEETLSTLRFASRMKCVRTDPTINEHTDPALQIKKLQQEIQMLKEELSMYKTPNELLPGAQLAEIDSQVQRFLDGSLKEITVTSIRQAQALFAQIKLAVQEQKQKVMAQLCHKCSLAEKNQNGNIGVIKEQDTRGGSDDVEAGSTGTSAQSPKQTRDPSSTTSKTVKLRDKQSQRKRQGGGSPASRKRSESASKSKLNSAQMPEREQESQKPDTESLDSQPPENKSFPPGVVSLPPKAEAFEDFKAGQGHMITCILKDNKAVLLERRGLLRQLTEDVSAVKRKIDCTTATIQQRKEMRETQGQYLVMEEEEELDDTLILQLRELKTLYQQRCAALRDIKAEVNYCQHLVDQCTVRLLSEFETWYKKTCLFPEEELQMTMSLAKWNKALSITPMQNSSSAGSGQRRHFPIPPVT